VATAAPATTGAVPTRERLARIDAKAATAAAAPIVAPAATGAAARRESAAADGVDLVVAAYVAGRAVPLPEEERNAAVRRALLVFAAGGDPHRDPALDDPAVLELARDLDSPQRRIAFLGAASSVDGGDALTADPELAWRAYACGLLAEAVGEKE